MPYGPIILKPKSILPNRIVTVGYNPNIHSSQDLQYSTMQPHRIQNWENALEEPKWFLEKLIQDIIILSIHQILEGVRAKIHEAILLFVDFSKAFDSIFREKMEQILFTYNLSEETVAAIMMLYKNMKVKVPTTGWRHRLLRHCSRCDTRTYISTVPVYPLSRLHA